MKCAELNKFYRKINVLNFGLQTTQSMAYKISKKMMRLNYKHYKRSIHENGDNLLQSKSVGQKYPTVAQIMDIPQDKYITISANDRGYGGTAEELIVNYVHPLFLKAESDASLEDNMNWCEATTGVCA